MDGLISWADICFNIGNSRASGRAEYDSNIKVTDSSDRLSTVAILVGIG
jgi:hypothetical protein